MFKKIFYILIAIVILGYIGFLEWKKNRPSIPQVRIDEVKKGNLTSTVLTTGIITSKEENTVFAKTIGILSDVLVEESEKVNKGDLLVEYQQEEALNALSQAQNQVDLAKVNYDDAEDKLARAKELFNTKGIPEIKVKEAENLVKSTKIQLNITKKQLELAEKKIKDFNITSPQDGTVTKKTALTGSATAPGTPLFIISNTEELEIEANIDEVDASSIRNGQTVIINSAILQDKEFTGHIEEIANNATIQKGITVIKTTISPAEKLPFKIGNIVDLEIITNEKDNVLYVPIEAVHYQDDKKYVFKYKDNHAYNQSVVTGTHNFNFTEIKKGLYKGEKIIVSSDKTLHDSDRVTLLKE